MTVRIQRFDFGATRDFRGPITLKTVPEEVAVEAAPVVPPAPTFNEAELEAAKMIAKKEAYIEGFSAGKKQAIAEADIKAASVNETLSQLGTVMEGLNERYKELLAREAVDLSELVLVIAKKVAGDALDARGVETINALVARCLPVMFSKPKLMVDLHPDMFERGIERIETCLQANGFEGEIQFRSNPNIGPHDVVLDWGAGNATRSSAALWQEIETLLERIPLEMTFNETLNQTTTPTT